MPSLDHVFAALADPTRRAILARLATGELSVTTLTGAFAISQPAISKHLRVLERAGLVSRRRDARFRPCRLEAAPLHGAAQWIDGYRQFWEASFDRLEVLARALHALETASATPTPVKKRSPHGRSAPRRGKRPRR